MGRHGSTAVATMAPVADSTTSATSTTRARKILSAESSATIAPMTARGHRSAAQAIGCHAATNATGTRHPRVATGAAIAAVEGTHVASRAVATVATHTGHPAVATDTVRTECARTVCHTADAAGTSAPAIPPVAACGARLTGQHGIKTIATMATQATVAAKAAVTTNPGGGIAAGTTSTAGPGQTAAATSRQTVGGRRA